jgi:hypothetical protein
LDELTLMCLSIENIDRLIVDATRPLYLRATLLMPHKKARIERLISQLGSTKMVFEPIRFL